MKEPLRQHGQWIELPAEFICGILDIEAGLQVPLAEMPELPPPPPPPPKPRFKRSKF
jgi:hypothetical protein